MHAHTSLKKFIVTVLCIPYDSLLAAAAATAGIAASSTVAATLCSCCSPLALLLWPQLFSQQGHEALVLLDHAIQLILHVLPLLDRHRHDVTAPGATGVLGGV